ncbi:MAG TPA: GNAT family N-acetyltransferase [Gemmatimonadota bacterium]|nr:GNAT family N-acetyltransferase [Gemmatimonadota bacterium]
MVIRHVRVEDAEMLLALHLRLDEETDFMLQEPGERSDDVEVERERIRGLLSRDNQALIVAEVDGQLVGYVAILGGPFRRNRHSAYIVIGVLKSFNGQGIGGSLLGEAERWAKNAGLHRIELTVMAHNTRAIHLYEGVGFAREGTRKHALRINGAWVDEFYMAKLLG